MITKNLRALRYIVRAVFNIAGDNKRQAFTDQCTRG